MKDTRVIVVGAGMAGLACAVRLCQRGLDVTVLEAAPSVGGRTRNFCYRDTELDNGQHLMLSIYGQLQDLLNTVGASADNLRRLPFVWTVYARPAQVTPGGAPQPPLQKISIDNRRGLGALARQLSAVGTKKPSIIQKLSFGAGVLSMLFRRAPEDLSARQWLEYRGQNPALIQLLWAPLCLAALNTSVDKAAATCLQAVLRRVLPNSGRLSFVFNRTGLGRALAEPCQKFLEKNGGQVCTGERVSELLCSGDRRISGVRTHNGRHWKAGTVILSVPAPACVRLLRQSPAAASVLNGLCALTERIPSAPIHTLYLQFSESLGGSEAIFGFLDEDIDWVIDREIVNGQRGLLAAVSSARRIQTPVETILKTLGEVYGALPSLLWHKAVLEKHATVMCTPQTQALRPDARTPIDGLWLNGDWTRNPLPATIETAVSNGFDCAGRIWSASAPTLS